ncbi:short chain dehydrogenase family protein [Metarhizium robertsii]|uniref:Short chain dehydrogenase family protein n=1 Tax=Metarhizium robertsii TaxID=568076 RepID=A0A014PFP8_9HYPO|nr:short chain dehydrogenase family protein [Metarhizium robertsii]
MPSYAITGASKGIGREFVRQLAIDPSNTVFAIVRDPEVSRIKELSQQNSNVHLVKGNVTDPVSMLMAATEVTKITGGTLDVLIHNANAFDQATYAYGPSQVPLDIKATEDFFDAPIRTAIYGGLWSTNAFLPLIEKGAEKKVVHISTGMADLDLIKDSGIEYALAYAVAKAGMNVQVAKYAVELAPKGIKVLALSPGWVDTFEGVAGEKPPQLVEGIEVMRKQLEKLPHPIKGPMNVEESVKMQLKVIDSLDSNTSGSFLSHYGVRDRW